MIEIRCLGGPAHNKIALVPKILPYFPVTEREGFTVKLILHQYELRNFGIRVLDIYWFYYYFVHPTEKIGNEMFKYHLPQTHAERIYAPLTSTMTMDDLINQAHKFKRIVNRNGEGRYDGVLEMDSWI